MTVAELLTLIEARAPGLRAAGVLGFEVEGAKVQLAPYAGDAATSVQSTAAEPEPTADPLDDPATFGGVLPGYRIPGERDQPEGDP